MHSTAKVTTFTKGLAILMLVTVVVCQRNGCRNRQNQMTCLNLTEFPEDIPQSTERMTFWYLKLDEIPSGAFDNLPNLTKIEIYESEIKYLKGCTFSYLSNLYSLTLHSVRVQEIEPFAFQSLSSIEKLILYNVTVDVIHSNAFFNISLVRLFDFHNLTVEIFDSYAVRQLHGIGSLNIFNSNIEKLKSNAFFALDAVERFQIRNNRIEKLECRTVETLSKTVPSFLFYKNEIGCSCSLSWLLPLIHSHTNGALKSDLQFNSCKGQKKGALLTDLTASDFNCGQETSGSCFSSLPLVSYASCGHAHQDISTIAHLSTSQVSRRGQTFDYRSPSTSDLNVHLSLSGYPDTTTEGTNFPMSSSVTQETVSSTTEVDEKRNPEQGRYLNESNSLPSSTSLLPTEKTTDQSEILSATNPEKLTKAPLIRNVTLTFYNQDFIVNYTSATTSATTTPRTREQPTTVDLHVSKRPVVANTTVKNKGFVLEPSRGMTQSSQATSTTIHKAHTRASWSPTSATATGDTKTSSPAPRTTKAVAIGSGNETLVSRQAETESNSGEIGILDNRQALERRPKQVMVSSNHEADMNSGEVTLSSMLFLSVVCVLRYMLV